MNFDEMILVVEDLNERQGVSRSAVPHGSNLIHQFRKNQIARLAMYEEMLSLYINTRTIPYDPDDLQSYVQKIVNKTNVKNVVSNGLLIQTMH